MQAAPGPAAPPSVMPGEPLKVKEASSASAEDFDSDEELTELSYDSSAAGGGAGGQGNGLTGDRRAHHNALERKRRDHIKDSFLSLKEAVPALTGEKASRTLILRKACDYIESMRDRVHDYNADINAVREQNAALENKIRSIEERSKTGLAVGGVGEARPVPLASGAGHFGGATVRHTNPVSGEKRVIRVSIPGAQLTPGQQASPRLLSSAPQSLPSPARLSQQPSPALPAASASEPPPKVPKI